MKRYGVCLVCLLTLLTSCTTETIPDTPVTTPETVPTETTVIPQPKETISPPHSVLSMATGSIKQELYWQVEDLVEHLVAYVMDEEWLAGTDTFSDANMAAFLLSLPADDVQEKSRHPYRKLIYPMEECYELYNTDVQKIAWELFGREEWSMADWAGERYDDVTGTTQIPIPTAWKRSGYTCHRQEIQWEGDMVTVACEIRGSVDVAVSKPVKGSCKFVFRYIEPSTDTYATMMTAEPYLRLTEVTTLQPYPRETIDREHEVADDVTGTTDGDHQYCPLHTVEYHNFDGLLIDYIGADLFQDWIDACADKEPVAEGCLYYVNIYHLIYSFEIPRAVVEEVYYGSHNYYIAITT